MTAANWRATWTSALDLFRAGITHSDIDNITGGPVHESIDDDSPGLYRSGFLLGHCPRGRHPPPRLGCRRGREVPGRQGRVVVELVERGSGDGKLLRRLPHGGAVRARSTR